MRPPITGPSASAGTQTSVQGRTWCCTRCTFLDGWCHCPCRGPDRRTHHRDTGRRQRSRTAITGNCRAQACGGLSPGTQVVFNLFTTAANGCTQPLPTERGLEVVVRGSVREQVRWWGREVGQQVGQRGGLRWGAVVHAVLRRTPLVPVPEHWLSLFHRPAAQWVLHAVPAIARRGGASRGSSSRGPSQEVPVISDRSGRRVVVPPGGLRCTSSVVGGG